MNDLRNFLNPSQFAAVTTLKGPVLVIAGAGSGKTRVIEYRVLYLVQNNITPESILLLTFTRRAAHEMLGRTGKHDLRCKDVEGGTFHSFAFKMLMRYAKIMGFTDSFIILDEGDAEDAIQRCCNKLGFFEKQKRFPKKDTLKKIISISINKDISIEEVLKKEFPHLLEYTSDIENLRRKYTEYKINKNFLDYDDLLIYLKLLLKNEEIRSRLSQKYQFIMVDEYQDTNKLQGDITYLLAEKHRNIMVVGDDAQSIYGFRGASHENIMDFPKKFPECKIIKLEENYRSTQSILDLANSVLENMKNKYSKCLMSARKESGIKPQLLFFKNSYEEAEWIVNKIMDLRNEGISLDHQAVLYRATYISIVLQAELSKRNIPFQVWGGLKFYETAHVKNVLSYLRVIINPKDELSWNRVLMHIEGIGEKTCERILEDIMAYTNFDEILTKAFQTYINKGYKYSDGLKKLIDTLKLAQNKYLNVGEQLRIILEYYDPILQNEFDDWHLRQNDLETLKQIAMRYTSLEEFLADFAIESPERSVWKKEPTVPMDEKPITLSTIHSAKGMEWVAVFIIGLIDGVLPVSFALNDENEIEEEHRLFYVSITRAKNYLFLSLHHEGTENGISQFNKVSRFIDMPNVLLKLDLNESLIPKTKSEIKNSEFKKITPVHDKKSLLEKIIELFK